MATVNGTSGNDTLSGSSGDDTINGLGGNDLFLVGSTGGNDRIDGGTGSDSIEFRERATSAVVVDFAAGTISGGSSGTISFTNVERVVAGNLNDSLTGNASSQTLTGYGGADTLAGAGGADTLWGGAGADTFVFRETGTANADRINDFTSGSDKILLDASVMNALGAAGNFAAGDDRFVLNSPQDAEDRIIFNTTTKQVFYDADGNGTGAAVLIATLQSGATLAATDIVVEGGSTPPGGGQTINGTSGNDTLFSGPDDDTVNGFGGNDTIVMVDEPDDASDNPGNDAINGGDGIDWVVFSNGEFGSTDAVNVDLAAGTYSTADSASGTLANIENVAGSLYDDELRGTDAANWLSGNEGNDTLEGRGGNDTLGGGGGADRLNGGDGNDQLSGGDGDALDGGLGNDTYSVVAGASILPDLGGVDDSVTAFDTDWTLAAGLENLRISHVDWGGAPHTAIGNELNNTIHGGEFGGTLRGMAGNDLLVAHISGPGITELHGGDGADTLQGGWDDALFGDAGNDLLLPGWGSDSLTGGAGADRFLFDTDPDSVNVDTISDFVSATDKIVLDGNAHANSGPSGTFAARDARFWSSTTGMAHDADDRVIYDTDSGELWYDADGDAGGGRVLIATLQGTPPPTLAATDIEIVNGSGTPPPPPPEEGEVITGTSGDDSLTGTNADDTIDGLGGNDTLNGFAGDDSLVGGDGDDLLVGEVGRDLVAGGAGADVLAHGFWNNDDTLDGGLGEDTLLLQGAASAVTVDLAARTMSGGDSAGTAATTVLNIEFVNAGGLDRPAHMVGTTANNFLRGGAAADHIFGNDGDDTVYGSLFEANANGDELRGGAGNDHIAAFGGNGLLDGGTGNDALGGGTGIDRFLFSVAPGEANRDHVAFFSPGTDKLVLDGNAYPEIGLSGGFSSGDDRFAAYGGSGTPSGFDAEDRVLYNAFTGELWYDPDGNGIRAAQRIAVLQDEPWIEATDIEVINGSAPPPPEGEVINGTSGNDTLSGTGGSDTINGLGGNDLFLLGLPGGNDVIDGGTGHDTIELRERATGAVEIDFRGTTGEITAWPTTDDEIRFTNIERVVAGNFADTLTGNAASQTLVGRFGADTLWGGGGVDTLWGGGDGNTFVFRETGTANADRISDWTSGVDTIALDNATTGPMGALGAEGDFVAGDTRFASGPGFTSGRDTSDRVVFDTSTGRLYYDADGSGPGAAQLIATVQSGVSVAATDIVVI